MKKYLESKFELKPIFYWPIKLSKIIKVNKDKISKLENKDVVYKINCQDCEMCYVEQTERLLGTRA